jgi:hypothetical protein
MERKRQREQQVQHQQNVQTAGVVGNVGASFLGAVVGASLMNHHHGGYHQGGGSYEYESYDTSGVEESIPSGGDFFGGDGDGFDFGGFD